MELNRTEQLIEKLILSGSGILEITQQLRITERTFKFYLTSMLLKYKKTKRMKSVSE